MLIEYDLTKQELPILDGDATALNITNIGFASVLEIYQNPTYDAGVVGTHNVVGRARLKKLKRCTEFKYIPIHSLEAEIAISTSYGVKDAVVNSIECYNESGALVRTIENPGITIVDNASVGSYLLDLTDGAIDFTFNITVNQKEPYNNQYSNVTIMLNCTKVYIEDTVSPAMCIGSENTVLNATKYFNPYVNITYYPNVKPGDITGGSENSTVYNGEVIVFSIPEIACLPFEDGTEQEFSVYYNNIKYPFNITMEAYDKNDILLSSCNNEIVSSSIKPKFIYKEGLNYVKAKITCKITSSIADIQLRYPISNVHFIPDEIKYGVTQFTMEGKAYSTPNKEPIRCQLTTQKAKGYPESKYPDDIPEAFEYHICTLPTRASSTSTISMNKWKVYKEGDIVDIIPGSAVSVILRKISPEGHNAGSNYTGTVHDICFIATNNSGDSDNSTTPVDMTLNTSRNTAVNSNILTDSKRTTNKEDATSSKTNRRISQAAAVSSDSNRKVISGAVIGADIKRYSTKEDNKILDTQREVIVDGEEDVIRVTIKADTQRNKRKRIEVRYDLSRKLLGHKDNVYISSSLVPLEKAISKKLY